MKAIITFSIVFLTWGQIAQAQDTLVHSEQRFKILDLSAPKRNRNWRPLFILKTEEGKYQLRNYKALPKSIDVDWIERIEVMKGKNAIDSFGVLGQNGAVVIVFKAGIYKKLPHRVLKHKIAD